jgi:hypothetical protein
VVAVHLEGGECQNLRRLRATGALLQLRRLSGSATAVGDGDNYGSQYYGERIYGSWI